MTAIRSNRRRALQLGTALATCIACAGTANVGQAQELPGTATVVSGLANVPGHDNNDASLQINLRNTNSVINWNRFSIGDGQTVSFVSSVAGVTNTVTPLAVLNRVTGGTESKIDGAITSQNNIQVWLANPNGIVFGNGGSFSGGSLVLTTLVDDVAAQFASSNGLLFPSATLKGTSNKSITLDPGSTLTAGRDIVLVAQKISAGGKTSSGQDTAMIAAQDVTFSSGLGSPLSYTVNKGSSLSGLRVLGSADVEGENVAIVAGTVNDLVSNLLQVDDNAKLTATDEGGNVTLTALTTDGAAPLLTGAQLSTQGLLTAGESGDVRITSSGTMTVGGSIVAGNNVVLEAKDGGNLLVPAQIRAGLDYSVSGANIALGDGNAPVLQAGGRNVYVISSNGAITGDAGLTLRLNSGSNIGLSRVLIDAGANGTIDLDLNSKIIAVGTGANSASGPVGIRYDTATKLSLGDVTASRVGDYNGTAIDTRLTGAGDFTAGTILTTNTFDAQFGGNVKLEGATASGASRDVILNAGGTLETTGLVKAARNVTLVAGGTATISGAVDAGADYAVQGASVSLGNGTTPITQRADGTVLVTAGAGGSIQGAAGLTLRSNLGADSSANSLILDASSTGSIAFARGSTIAAGTTASGATNAAIGVRFDRTSAGPALELGKVTGRRLGDYTGGTTIAGTLTGGGDLVAASVTTNDAFNADFGSDIRIASVTTLNGTGDVTLRAGGLITGSQASAPAINIDAGRDISVTAGTDIAMDVIRGRDFSAQAGADFAPAVRQAGSLTLIDGDVSRNLALIAWGNGTGGQIRVGKALAGGTLTLDNTVSGGTSGSIKVGDRLLSDGLLTLHSAADILVARYAGGSVGTVTSTNGAITATAAGSVLAYNPVTDQAGTAFAITQAGFGAIAATGNLTVNTAAQSDVAVGSLDAGGNLTLNIAGNLYGRTQSTTQVPGAFFKAQGNVTVGAGPAAGVINLARVESGAAVTLSASEIALGTLVSGGATTLTAPGTRTYVGLHRIIGDGTVTLGDTFASVGTVTTGDFQASGTNLSAGGFIDATITQAAQLGTVAAGGSVAIRAGGIVADSVASSGAGVSISATSGTLALDTATAAFGIGLRKQGGSVLTAGDDVRFTTLTGGTGGIDGQAGNVVVVSQTNVRGNRIDALGGDADLSAGFNSGLNAVDQAGEITGLAGGAMRITATALSDAAISGRIVASTGGLGNYGQLKADDDISIVAGGTSAPLDGAIRIGDAEAGGSLYLSNKNATAGSVTDIRFGSLRADGDINLIASVGNGGGAVGALIDAGGDANLSVNDILVDRIGAGGNIALLATPGRITDSGDTTGIELAAGGGIAANAGLTIRVSSVQASTGDAALQASGVLTVGSVTAGDDVSLTGSSVRVGTATSTGTGNDATDVNFAAATAISDPYHAGNSALIPTVAGAQQPTQLGGNVSVIATAGDVTGLASNPLVTPALALVTTGDTLSGDYGSANLTVQGRSGSVSVSAANAAQLGTVRQGTAASGTGSGNIAVAARAISAGTVTSGTGNVTLNAANGTLVVGTVSAFDTASLVKAGASIAAGDELRFTSVTGGAGEVDPTRLATLGGERLGVIVGSATNVLGNSVTSGLGGVRVAANGGQVAGRTVSGLSIDATGGNTLQNVAVRSGTGIDLNTVTARDGISILAGAMGPQVGSIALVDARSVRGSIYLTAANTLAGAPNAITYNSLAAAGEIVAITSGSNRGDVSRLATSNVPFAIDAGTNVSIDAAGMDLDTVRTGSGNIALHATDAITAQSLQAGGSIAGLAGGAVSLGNAAASAGDVALRAGGVLTVATSSASDDVLLTGSSVRVGSVKALGGSEVGNAEFDMLASVADPALDGIVGTVPAFGSTTELAGSSIAITAALDVTGLAIDPLITPTLSLIATGGRLSQAYGAANLSAIADAGSIGVNAASGAAQLGTVAQGTSTTAGAATATGNVSISAAAISVDSVDANTGSVSLVSRLGTLQVGTIEAGGGVSLSKLGGDVGVLGDEVRFSTIRSGTLGSSATGGGVQILSQTHVRGQRIDALSGDVVMRSGYDAASDITNQAGEITGLGFTPLAPAAMSAVGDGLVRISSGGRGEFGQLSAGGDLSVITGGTSAPFDGALRIASANAGGDLYLTNRNATIGSTTGIGVGSLDAGGDIVLLTASANGGSATGATIVAGGGLRVSAASVSFDSIGAAGEVALAATSGAIDIGTLTAAGIGAKAASSISIDTAEATSGDLALLANGAITANSLIAADDVALTGSSLALGIVNARGTGTGTDTGDVDFAGAASAFDPRYPAFTGPIPTVNGAKLASSTGGNIVAIATAGDITVSNTASAQGSALFGATGAVEIATGTANSGTLGIQAGGDVNSGVSLTAGEDIAIQSGGAVRLAAATAGDDLTVTAPGSIAIDSAVITGAGLGNTDVTFGAVPTLAIGGATLPGNTFSLTSASGNIVLGAVNTGGSADAVTTLTSTTGSLSVTRDLAVRGGLVILAGGDVTLGDGADRSVTATGLLSVTSTGGSIVQGAGRLTLAADTAGSGGHALTLSAQDRIALGNTDLVAGPGKQSAIGLTTTNGAIAIGSASGATFTANAGTDFTAVGAIAAGSAALGADTASPTVGITARNGSITATTIDADQAGHDVYLSASNAITLDRVTAARSITATGATFNANTLAATGGTLNLAATGAIGVGSSTVGGDASYTSGGDTSLGTIEAGGAVMVDSAGAATLTDVRSGDVTLIRAATSINAARLGSGGALTIEAGADATLGTISAAGNTAITALGAVVQTGSLVTQGTLGVTAGTDVTLASVKATGAVRLDSKAGALAIGDLTTGAEATLTAGTSTSFGTINMTGAATLASGGATTGTALVSGGVANVTTGGALTLGRLSTGGITNVTTATSAKIDQLSSGGATTIKAGTDATLGAVSTTGNMAVTAVGAVVQTGDLSTQGTLDVTGTNVTLASVKATGAVRLDSKAGALAIGDLTTGAEATLAAGTSTSFGMVNTTGAATLTSGGDTTGTALVSGGVANVTTGGALTLGQLSTGGITDVTTATSAKIDQLSSGGATTIKAGTDATLGAVSAAGNTAITAAGAVVQTGELSTQGTLDVTGTNVTLASVKATGAVRLDSKAGALAIGDLTTDAGATLNAGTSATFGTINTTGSATLTSGGGTTGTALVSGGAANVTTGGALTLGRLSSGAGTTVTTATSAKIDQLSSGGALAVKAGTDATLGTVTSAGDAGITAKGTLKLNGAFNASGRTVTLTARDAAIGADVTAATIKVVNDASAGNTLVLGDGATGTGFALGNAEVGHLKASSLLVFDTVSPAVKQDVSIGTLSLVTPPKVLVLADGTRIDVTGKIDVSGGTTSLQLGGSGEDAGLASVLRVAAKANGSGGSIAAPAANVILRAANIGFGQDGGFLSALGIDTGTGDGTVARTLNDRASSTLYFAGTGGGAPYTPSLAGVKLLTANTLTVDFTNFALFQNTGVQGQTSGVDIGTFLTVNATGPQPVLGLFGSLAGRQGTEASLLGSLAFQINLNDIRSSRINGCVVGEGSGCITTLVFSPNLATIDAVRPSLFTVASDYEVPFNPLIGTNNDALFGDVGTFGLAEIVLDPIECSDPGQPQCPAPTVAVPPAPAKALPSPASSATPSQKVAQ